MQYDADGHADDDQLRRHDDDVHAVEGRKLNKWRIAIIRWRGPVRRPAPIRAGPTPQIDFVGVAHHRLQDQAEIALEQIQWACAVWHSVFTQCELAFDPRLLGTSTPWNDHALTFRPYDEAQRLPRLSGF